jgi:hypothetical protein
MPSKLNSEFNYRFLVIGETPWEKIKTLKGFLEGRIRAAALEQVASLKYQSKLSELKCLMDNGAKEYIILSLKAELVELESVQESQKEAFHLNRKEIVCLESLLEELYLIAEPSRIEGYSDEDMFEANAANEFTVAIGKELQAEIVAYGRPQAATVRNALRCPEAAVALKKLGLLPEIVGRLEGNLVSIIPELKEIPIQGDTKCLSKTE